jgi:hypothetical protein
VQPLSCKKIFTWSGTGSTNWKGVPHAFKDDERRFRRVLLRVELKSYKLEVNLILLIDKKSIMPYIEVISGYLSGG